MFLSGMLNAIFTRLDYMIIGKLFDPASLGFFQRAKSFNLFIIKYSSGSLMSVLFPVLSKIQKDIPRLQRVVLKSLTILSLITFLLVGGLYVVSQELVVLLFGDKWLPSVMYFKILALSSFSYPLGSLFVSILSSRGKSKAFLRLEIYKKIVCLGSIVVLYMYGIDAFLYALVIQAFINAIWLNITYASREIDLSFWRLFQPILIQMLFAIFSVYLVYYINQTVDFNDFVMLCIKGIEYLVVFVSLNKLFATEAYKNIKLELQPIYNKLLKKVRHDR
jgi:O-antigen/teichoic acid export membrane protein